MTKGSTYAYSLMELESQYDVIVTDVMMPGAALPAIARQYALLLNGRLWAGHPSAGGSRFIFCMNVEA